MVRREICGEWHLAASTSVVSELDSPADDEAGADPDDVARWPAGVPLGSHGCCCAMAGAAARVRPTSTVLRSVRIDGSSWLSAVIGARTQR